MYVCVCLAVTEAEVEAAIAGGAQTRACVTRACGAGGDCGACHGMIEEKIEDHLEANAVQAGDREPAEGQPSPVRAGSGAPPDFVSVDALVALVRGRAA